MGEWLTRQISGGQVNISGNSIATATPAQDLGQEARTGDALIARPFEDSRSMASFHEAQERLARTSPLAGMDAMREDDLASPFNALEEHLRILSRRLERTERGQTESNLALTQAAGEINLATREQAQAFDQLSSHVITLGDRLGKVERATRESQAPKQATQIATLATTMEAVVVKMTEVRDQAAQDSTTLRQKLEQIETRLAQVEGSIAAESEAIAEAMHRLEGRQTSEKSSLQLALAEMDERHIDLSDEFRQSIKELDNRYGARRAELQSGIEHLSETQAAQRNEVQSRFEALEAQLQAQHSAMALAATQQPGPYDDLIQRMEHTVGELASRMVASEEKSDAAMARLEDGFSRIENAEKTGASATQATQQALRDLEGKIDQYENSARAAIADLGSSLKLTETRLEMIEDFSAKTSAPLEAGIDDQSTDDAAAANTVVDEAEAGAAPDIAVPKLGGPRFEDAVSDAFADSAIHRAFGNKPDMTPPVTAPEDDELFRPDTPMAADGFNARAFDEQDESDPIFAGMRRIVEGETASSLDRFSWGTKQGEAPSMEDAPRSRIWLIGGIALVAILAIVAGVLMSQRFASQKSGAASVPGKVQTAPVAAKVEPVAKMAAAVTTVTPAPPGATPEIAKPAVQQVLAASPKPVADRLSLLADGGNAKAQLLLGLKYLDGEGVKADEARAATYLQRAAEQGEPVAQYRLGTMFERGQGLVSDQPKAVQWYDAAARQGNRKAMHNLAVAHAEGTGTAKNFAEAARWFARAAALGLADSQFNLAVLHERGLGVPQSLNEAYKWYAIAAVQGDTESKARVDALATQLSPEARNSAQAAADGFKPDALNRTANIPPESPGPQKN